MRFTYYVFPRETRPRFLCVYGCRAICDDGEERLTTPKEYDLRKDRIRDFILEINVSVRRAKKLLRRYGGYAYTLHCNRDGGVFETTEIALKGVNSRFRFDILPHLKEGDSCQQQLF